LFFCSLKIGALLLVDDSLIYAKQCAAEGIPVILFGHYPWNRGIDEADFELLAACQNDRGSLIRRVSSWQEVVDEVHYKTKSVVGVEVSSRVSDSDGSSSVFDASVVSAVYSSSSGRSISASTDQGQQASQPPPPPASSRQLKVAAIQMCSTDDKAENLAATERLIARAVSESGSTFICLPECAAFMASPEKNIFDAAETISHETPGTYTFALSQLAQKYGVWLSVGGFPERRPDLNCDKVSNTHFLIDPTGQIRGKPYRKIHLFDNPLTGLQESKTTGESSKLATRTCTFHETKKSGRSPSACC
jgi:Carbon-nitrogen hydrolase